MNFDDLSEKLQERILDREFLNWIVSTLDRETIGDIAEQLKIPWNDFQLKKLDIALLRNRLINNHNRKKLAMLDLLHPLFQYIDVEQQENEKEMEEEELKEKIEREFQRVATSDELTRAERASLYFFRNDYEKALALYDEWLQYAEEEKEQKEKKKKVQQMKETMKEQQKDLERDLEKRERRLQRLEKDYAQAQQEVRELKEELQQLRREKHQEKNLYNQQLADYERDVEEKERQARQAREQLKEEIEQLQAMNEQLTEQIETLQQARQETLQGVADVSGTTKWHNYKWDSYVIGRLADYGKTVTHQPIFINKTDVLQFWLKCQSIPSDQFPEEMKHVTSWSNYLPSFHSSNEYISDEERMQRLKDYLEQYVVLFKVQVQEGHFSAYDLHVLPRKETFTGEETFETIPVFNASTNEYSTIAQFIEALQKGEFVGRNDDVSHDYRYDHYPIIFYRETNGKVYAVGTFDSFHYAHGGFRFDVSSHITYTEIPEQWFDDMYALDNVAFLMSTHFDQLLAHVQQFGKKEEKIEKSVPQLQTFQLSPEQVSQNKEENEWLQRWIYETERLQLTYNKEDLYNFHTCVKSGGLTILAGMSGTGKSQLVQTYQRSLGLKEDQFLFIPVSPTWTDDADILGYVDMAKNYYRPASTGLVDLLKRAEARPEESFIICFDEMNLARIEHYFSQFLSVLERDEEVRELTLYNEALAPLIANSDEYPPKVTIGRNVFFTGTVNLDESTHVLSDKVLDRANVMTLQVEPFHRFLQMTNEQQFKAPIEFPEVAIQSFIETSPPMSLNERELSFLWDVHELLATVTLHAGIGPRIVRRIDMYMKNAQTLSDETLSAQRAFDLQFVQRIGSKIRGTEEMLRHVVGIYDEAEEEVKGSRLLDLFDRYNDLSDFKTSRMLIAEKAKELTRNGYAF